MTVKRSLVLMIALSLVGAAAASEPADREIAAAIADIERYEQEYGGLSEARAANVNRVKRLLGLTRERLDGSAHRDDPSWIEADQRLEALLAHLDGLLAPPAAAGSAAAVAPEAATASPAAPQMISQDQARIAKLNRDIQSSVTSLDQGGPKPFQDPAYVAEWEQVLQRHRQALERFADFPDEPDVRAATAAFQRVESMMAFGRQHAERELAELGDVQARLRQVNDRLIQNRVPETPTHPYAPGAVEAWLVALAEGRAAAVADAQALQPIKQRAHLPETRGTPEQGAAYDFQDVQRLEAGLVQQVRAIDEVIAKFSADLDLQIADAIEELDYVDGLDPMDAHAQANVFLGEGQAETMRGRLAEVRSVVQAAVDFDRRLGRENDRAALPARVEQTAAGYEAKREAALSVVRMPDAASTEPELIEIARTTLANPDYAAGPIERLVVNVDRRSFEMESSDIEIDRIDVSLGGNVTASGTQTTYHYVWDQFQVATAEPVGDRHFIFYNTLKYFTSGAPTTPLKRWILAERLQTVEIPKANIALD